MHSYTVVALAVASCAAMLGCNGVVAPRESYEPGVANFATLTGELASAVNTTLADYRTDLRIDTARYALATHLATGRNPRLAVLQPKFGQPNRDEGLPQDEPDRTSRHETVYGRRMLCLPRLAYMDVATNRDYLGAIASALKTTAAAPSKDFGELLSALGTSYKIEIVGPADANIVEQACVDDLRNYRQSVFPTAVPTAESALGVVAALEGLYEVFNTVFKPLATAVLQEVDAARKAAALKAFLDNDDNRIGIAQALEILANELNAVRTRERHLRTYEFVKALDLMLMKLAASDAEMTLLTSKVDSCVALAALRTPRSSETLAFRKCFAVLWEKWDPHLKQVLTTAAAYDSEADKSPNDIIDNIRQVKSELEKISDGEITVLLTKQVFAVAMRLVALAQTAKETWSDEKNEKKVEEALSKLRKALKEA